MKKPFILLILCLFTVFNLSVFAFGSDVFDSLEARAVYVDGSGAIKLIAYKLSEVPEGMTLTVDGVDFTDNVQSEGSMVYQYTDTDLTAAGSVDITFSAGGESVVLTAPVIEIVEGASGEWTASDDGHSLLTYNGSDAEVTVPNFYNNKPIMIIGGKNVDGSYINILDGKKTGITKITLSNGITAIYHYAFRDISSLKTVVFPDTLRSIGGVSFYGTGIAQDLVLPASTKNIYANAFRGTKITSLTLNEGLEKIGAQAFINCTKLSGSLVLPSTLTEIGKSAFYGCSSLTGDLVIPPGVKSIDEGTFFKCGGFNGKLVISEGVEELGFLSFGNSGAYNHFTSLELPSTLKKIGPYCFQNCSSIKYLTLNEGLETISDGAFDHCSGLENEKIIIPASVKIIGGDYDVEENTNYGDHVFYDAGKDSTFKAFEVADGNEFFTAVDGVLYDKNVTRMIAYPRGKTDETFVLPDTVTQLDGLSFSRPTYLKKLVLPDNFVLSDSVPENSLNQDGNNLSIALYVFNNLQEIAVNDTNENYTVKNGVLYSKDGLSVWYIPQGAQGDVVIEPPCERLEKGCVYISDVGRVKWQTLCLPDTVNYVDPDVLKMLNETANSARTDKIHDRLVYTGDMYIIYIQGDADLNGTVNENDARTVLYANARGESVFSTVAADMNNDGKVDIRDAVLILGTFETE